MRPFVTDYQRLKTSGAPVGRAVVVEVWGSAPRRPGACLFATSDGKLAGSISGGCVESATATEIAEALDAGRPRMVEYGVSDETAWEVGLACGGTIRVLVEPAVRAELLDALADGRGVVLATVIAPGEALGTALLFRENGSQEGPLAAVGVDGAGAATQALEEITDPLREAALHALHDETARVETVRRPDGHEAQVFLETHPRQPKLVVFGGVHVAAVLVTLARSLGFRTVVADGREAFVTRERFPDADELIHAWPEEAFAQIGPDEATYVCVLSHDPKFDDPAVQIALRSPARYVGAIGSRKNQAERRERLAQAGLTAEEIGRLRGPIGLDLGGREPHETALAILAEITAVRYGGSGRSMTAEVTP